jgi:prepilin-type processing-associated H-X9-DG protein
MNPQRRRALTLIELLVIVGILALVISLLLPAIARMRETSGRQRCPSNLRQIGQAILLYMNENKGAFPRTICKAGVTPVWGTGASSANPFAGPERPADNDVTAALFLLIRTQDITSEVFVCGSDDRTKDSYGGGGNTALNRSNFTDWRKNLSYSFANPYVYFESELQKKRFAGDAEFAIAADLNPGVGDGFDVTAVAPSSKAQDMQRANSRNHTGAGQNVLFGDGHVEFVMNPFCGAKRDNIYTVSGSIDGSVTTSRTVVGPPAWDGDSVLLPALP